VTRPEGALSAGANLSHGEINRLGERLRAGAASADDFRLLQSLRAGYVKSLESVAERLRSLVPEQFVYELTTRIKTETTIVDKLRREPGMNLSRMDDIAGARMVVQGGRQAQDEIAAIVSSALETRAKDRRANPSFGYRALHLIVRLAGRSVELQVRTSLQDKWAQLLEGLGDRWGRQIRYGQPPNDATLLIGPDVTRQDLLEHLIRFSDFVAQVEALAQGDVRSRERLEKARTLLLPEEGEKLAEIERGMLETRALIDRLLRDADDQLGSMADVLR
jgi:hypothetical protein